MRRAWWLASSLAALIAAACGPDGGPNGGDGEDVRPVWTHESSESEMARVALARDGSAVFAGIGSQVYLLGGADGSERWSERSRVDEWGEHKHFQSVGISADGEAAMAATMLVPGIYAFGPGGLRWIADEVENPAGGFIWLSAPGAISADGRVIAAGMPNLSLFGAGSADPVLVAPPYRGTWVALSGDGSTAAAHSPSHGIVFFSPPGPEPAWVYAYDEIANSLALSEDGSTLVVGTDQRVHVLARTGNEPLWTFVPPGRSDTASVVISADGGQLASGGSSGEVHLFGRDSATPRWTHQGPGEVRALALSADGRFLAAGFSWGNLSFFDTASATPVWSWKVQAPEGINSLAISGDGSRVVVGTVGKVYAFGQR